MRAMIVRAKRLYAYIRSLSGQSLNKESQLELELAVQRVQLGAVDLDGGTAVSHACVFPISAGVLVVVAR